MTSAPSDTPRHRDREQLEETWLVLRCQQGHMDAFEALVNLFERRLLYYVMRMVQDEASAWDVLQEVWIVVFRRITKLKDPRAFRVWLYRIAHDRAVSRVRQVRRRDRQDKERELAAGPEEDPVEDLAHIENVELLHAALQRLSPPHREALTLYFLEGMDYAQIAEVTRTSIGTVRSRLHYARKQVRQWIEVLGGHD